MSGAGRAGAVQVRGILGCLVPIKGARACVVRPAGANTGKGNGARPVSDVIAMNCRVVGEGAARQIKVARVEIDTAASSRRSTSCCISSYGARHEADGGVIHTNAPSRVISVACYIFSDCTRPQVELGAINLERE